jgi:hypothetical protein
MRSKFLQFFRPLAVLAGLPPPADGLLLFDIGVDEHFDFLGEFLSDCECETGL